MRVGYSHARPHRDMSRSLKAHVGGRRTADRGRDGAFLFLARSNPKRALSSTALHDLHCVWTDNTERSTGKLPAHPRRPEGLSHHVPTTATRPRASGSRHPGCPFGPATCPSTKGDQLADSSRLRASQHDATVATATAQQPASRNLTLQLQHGGCVGGVARAVAWLTR